MNPAVVPHPQKTFSVEFFEPHVALINIHANIPGSLHACIPCLERQLRDRLSAGSEFQLIFNPGSKRDDSFTTEDIELIRMHMHSLSKRFSCHSAYFIMNDGLHYHINRTAVDACCTHGVHRAASLGDAIRQIEDALGIEVIFDSLPVSCC